jgi:hypothetical protein
MYPAVAICPCHIDAATALGDDAAMTKSIALALVAFAMLPFACGGDSGPANDGAFCLQSNSLLCDKAYACVPVAGRDADFVNAFGNSLAECKSTAQSDCAGFTCNGPYNASAARTCLNKGSAESCADAEAGIEPDECETACPR